MGRNYKQLSVAVYPDTEELLEEVMKASGTLKSSVLRTAIKLGLQQMLAMHKVQQQQIDNFASDYRQG